jgi:predicted DCC family thiol-disulfide oxidoreductase YuxK
MTPELRRACVGAVHVFTTRGRVLRGGAAVMFLLERILPHPWRLFARLLARPPLVWPVNLGYEIVARNRRHFARFILPDEAETSPEKFDD